MHCKDDQKRIESPKFAVQAGSDILVIGRPITRSVDPLNSIKQIIENIEMSNSVSIKICGINNSESAKACTNADYVGLVFFQKSVRFVTAFQAKKLTTFLPKNLRKLVFSLTLILI